MVASSILEDLKCIALKRCSSQKNSVMKSFDDTFAIDMKGSSKVFSVSKYSYNMTDFLDKLKNEKRINLNLDIWSFMSNLSR